MPQQVQQILVLILVAAYLVLPFDLIPDITPVFGWFDDLAFVALAYIKWRSDQKQDGKKIEPDKKKRKSNRHNCQTNKPQLNDPYRALGLVGPASQDEIKRAFHRLAKQYHPDKASTNIIDKAHANEKMAEISNAYNRLRKVG